jgi:hypothetical protein
VLFAGVRCRRWRPYNESNRAAHTQGGYANAAPDARLQSLGSDLPATQHDDGVDGFKRNTLVSFGRRYQQRPTAMLHVRPMVTDVYSIQVAHSNTTVFTYLLTLCGALVTLGRQ